MAATAGDDAQAAVEIADAEKRLEAQLPTHAVYKDLAAQASLDPKSRL
jgi:hypothetical protein